LKIFLKGNSDGTRVLKPGEWYEKQVDALLKNSGPEVKYFRSKNLFSNGTDK
jgi:hypothetical protein